MHINVAKKLFENVRGTGFAGIDALTIEPRLKRDEAVQPGVVTKKLTGATVMIFAQEDHTAFSVQVKRRMEKEGLDPDSWESGPLLYGEWIDDTMFIVHTKKGATEPTYYLRVHFVNSGKVEHFLDGKPIAKADIVNTSAPKSKGGQGGQADQIQVRNYKLDSITAIRIDGTEYKV